MSFYSGSDCAASFMIISPSMVDNAVELKLEVLCVQTSRSGSHVGIVRAGVQRCSTQA